MVQNLKDPFLIMILHIKAILKLYFLFRTGNKMIIFLNTPKRRQCPRSIQNKAVTLTYRKKKLANTRK